jgi:predicted esterase
VTRPLVLVVVAVLISGSLLMTFNGFRRVFRGGSDDADLPPPYDPAGKKLRILCLHGYHGSAATMRRQASGATALLAPYADLFFLDAPSRSHGDFGWWHATSNRAIVYEGWEATRRGVKLAWDTQGPFDGVLGFSQGAVLASLLVALPEFPFEFAIMAGGFAARDPRLAALYERNKEKYAIPSLHIYGRADGIVDPRASAALSDKFVNPTTIVHE